MRPSPEECFRLRNSHCERKGAEGCVPVGPEAVRRWGWWEGVSRGGGGEIWGTRWEGQGLPWGVEGGADAGGRV